MKYISLLNAIKMHDRIIDKFGGIKGYNQVQIGYLEGALEHIQNDLYYPNLEDKVSHLMFACVKFHPFSDANKRTSIALSNMFLKVNNIIINADEFNEKMEDIVVKLATDEINKDDLKNIFKNLIDNSINEMSIIDIEIQKMLDIPSVDEVADDKNEKNSINKHRNNK